jgi:hypothetical protein
VLLALLLTVGGYIALRHSVPVLEPSSCAAAAPGQPVPLNVGQAGIAATIAGVAQRRDLPRRAVTIAYATALQESKLTNLRSGDRDSVGVFQQRPSQGWGTTQHIEDPVYATTRFFDALVQVPGYQHLPVYQAAQAVQHSADGYAYNQYAAVASNMSRAFTGVLPHAVWCWYTTPLGRQRLAAAGQGLARAFGPLRTWRSGDPQLAVRVARRPAGWAVAAWLVTHAASYGIKNVQFQGYEWLTKDGTSGWTPVKSGRVSKGPPGVVLFG